MFNFIYKLGNLMFNFLHHILLSSLLSYVSYIITCIQIVIFHPTRCKESKDKFLFN